MITREELKSLIDSKADYVLIDVREPWELDEYGSIPTAHNIPLGELSEALDMSKEQREQKYGVRFGKDDRLIFYCRSGGRSARAAAHAKQHGFNAHNYAGSALDWAEIDSNVKKY